MHPYHRMHQLIPYYTQPHTPSLNLSLPRYQQRNDPQPGVKMSMAISAIYKTSNRDGDVVRSVNSHSVLPACAVKLIVLFWTAQTIVPLCTVLYCAVLFCYCTKQCSFLFYKIVVLLCFALGNDQLCSALQSICQLLC